MSYVVAGAATQRLNLYYPTSGVLPLPCMIVIHGGGWQTGDKALPGTGHVFSELKSNGIVLAATDHRRSTETTWPDPVYDIKAAVRWLQANAHRLGINPHRIGIWGVSSGAHLAALVAATGTGVLTDTNLGNATMPEDVKVCVCHSTPTDFPEEDGDWSFQTVQNGRGFAVCSTSSQEAELFGGDGTGLNPCSGSGLTKSTEASPQTYLTPSSCPKWLIEHGDEDATVPWKQGERLHNAVSAVSGLSSTWRLATGKGHTGSDWNDDATVRAATAAWIVANL